MINWIAGNWPDRFKCLVNHDGNLDERMAYYDTEELWFPEWEHGGTPWENPAGYTKHNPIDHVAKWKTPMLVIHGGRDYRVVDTQGMSTFTALQRKGIPSRFLYFPDENHWVLKPANSILWHETVLGWMDRWLKQPGGGTGSAVAPSAGVDQRSSTLERGGGCHFEGVERRWPSWIASTHAPPGEIHPCEWGKDNAGAVLTGLPRLGPDLPTAGLRSPVSRSLCIRRDPDQGYTRQAVGGTSTATFRKLPERPSESRVPVV